MDATNRATHASSSDSVEPGAGNSTAAGRQESIAVSLVPVGAPMGCAAARPADALGYGLTRMAADVDGGLLVPSTRLSSFRECEKDSAPGPLLEIVYLVPLIIGTFGKRITWVPISL